MCELLQTFLNFYGNMPDRIRRCDIKTNAFFILDSVGLDCPAAGRSDVDT